MNKVILMEDYGVNLLSVDDGIDSAGAAGKLMIAVLAAVAEIERENIQAQTMAGRIQKAREGAWNGGPAPYGYKIENGALAVCQRQAENVDFRRNRMSFFGGQHSSVYSPYTPLHLPA